jgi:hypothetical protein
LSDHTSRTDAAHPASDLPERNQSLLAIHYSQELIDNSGGQTPPVSAIVVQRVADDDQKAFSAFLLAEALGIKPGAFLDHFQELEKQLLWMFFEFVAKEPQTTVWLHWNMRSPHFGFEVRAQRARVHDLIPVEIDPARRFNLAAYLKTRYGDDYAPDPRLPNAIRQNGLYQPGMLNDEQAKDAWARKDFGAVLTSLCRKVNAIASPPILPESS